MFLVIEKCLNGLNAENVGNYIYFVYTFKYTQALQLCTLKGLN